MKFVWDDEKNEANKKKHQISFEEAIQVFEGPTRIEYDSEHSTLEEDRFKAYGTIKKHGLVVVVHVEILDSVIRIISARKVKK